MVLGFSVMVILLLNILFRVFCIWIVFLKLGFFRFKIIVFLWNKLYEIFFLIVVLLMILVESKLLELFEVIVF